MKNLYFVIFAIMFTLVIQTNHAMADPTKYYDEISSPPIQIISMQEKPLVLTIKQGESLQVPVLIKIDKRYELTTINNFGIAEIPDHVHTWFDTNMLSNKTINQQLFNVTMYIYADSNAPAGDYALKIIGRGLITDLTTGDAIQVMNFTAAQVPQGDGIEDLWQHEISSSQVLGRIHLKVLPVSNPVSMSVGIPERHSGTFCIDMGNGGTSCGGFGTYTEFPIAVYSQNKMNFTLHAYDITYGGWIKFSPSQLVVNPNGSSKMIIAGLVEPYGPPPPDTRALKIQILSDNKSIATSYVPLIQGQKLSILKSSGPINLDGQIINNINGTNFITFGAVYDPGDDSKKLLPVTLSVLGLADGSNISAMPSWIKVEIPKSSFNLNDSMPYYFLVKAITTNAPVGLHSIAIQENVGKQSFVSHLQVQVMQPVCTGGPGMCGPQPTPQEKQARTHLDFPFDVTTDSSGNIYVADSSNDRIVKFDPTGNYLMQFGISGKDDGQFMEPRGVAVDNSGDIYVADTDNDRIEKFDSKGNFLLKFGSHGTGNGQFHGPYVVTADKFGSVYVSDVGNARVQKFDSQGNFLLTFGSRGTDDEQFDELGRIAVDSSGYVYVTDITHGIQKFDSSGHFVSKIPLKATLEGNNAPDAYGIALDNSNNIFVAGNNQARIQKFDPQGNFKYEFGSFGSEQGQFNHPGSISIDNSGKILVADSDNNRIEKLDPSGKFVSEIHDWNLTSTQNYQQKMPEFPLVMPILIIGIFSTLVFYRFKSRMN